MFALGRGFVWIYVAVFMATVSCALACPQLDAGQKAFQMRAESTSDCCCADSRDGEYLNCVDTNFVQERKCVEALTAISPRDYSHVELTDINSSGQAFSVQILIPPELVFLRSDVLRI
ncbi:hypothetical protein MYX65_11305 [Acidobacteria bacterium AH-259-L09]|nr:hypothetical protein [Acidobacteria bacterium AH-259-L09]